MNQNIVHAIFYGIAMVSIVIWYHIGVKSGEGRCEAKAKIQMERISK